MRSLSHTSQQLLFASVCVLAVLLGWLWYSSQGSLNSTAAWGSTQLSGELLKHELKAALEDELQEMHFLHAKQQQAADVSILTTRDVSILTTALKQQLHESQEAVKAQARQVSDLTAALKQQLRESQLAQQAQEQQVAKLIEALHEERSVLPVNNQGRANRPERVTLCSEQQSQEIAELFEREGGPAGTNCPDEYTWFKKFRDIDPAPDKIFVNFGCNTGTDAVAFLNLYSEKYNLEEYIAKLSLLGSSSPVCPKPSIPRILRSISSAKEPKAYCVEAMKSTYELLEQIVPATVGDRIDVDHVAIGAGFPFIEYFPNGSTGYEALGIDHAEEGCTSAVSSSAQCTSMGGSGYHFCKATGTHYCCTVCTGSMKCPNSQLEHCACTGQPANSAIKPCTPVTAMTIDDYMAKKGLIATARHQGQAGDPRKNIDYMLVDTEGNDPLALFGASYALQQTRYLAFEHHGTGMWKKFALSTIVNYLENSFGFDCFWTSAGPNNHNNATSGKLWLVTSGCWHESYNSAAAKQWSNLACVKRNDVFWDIMMEIARQNNGAP